MNDIDISRQGPRDLDAIRQKYREERDIRLRQEGAKGQFVDVSGKYAHFGEDPYVPYVEREPYTDLACDASLGAVVR